MISFNCFPGVLWFYGFMVCVQVLLLCRQSAGQISAAGWGSRALIGCRALMKAGNQEVECRASVGSCGCIHLVGQ